MANYSAESLITLPLTAQVLLVDKKTHISFKLYSSFLPAGSIGSLHGCDSLNI